MGPIQTIVPSGVWSDIHYDGLGPTAVVQRGGQELDYSLSPTGVQIGLRPQGLPDQYLLGDGQGNISTMLGPAQQVLCTIRYDPWGGPWAGQSEDNPCNTGSSPNVILYRSQRRDSVLKTYQLGQRTYDPGKAAFFSPDRFRAAPPALDVALGLDPLTRNRYGYVNGDPVDKVDFTGHYQDSGGGCGHACDPPPQDPPRTGRRGRLIPARNDQPRRHGTSPLRSPKAGEGHRGESGLSLASWLSALIATSSHTPPSSARSA